MTCEEADEDCSVAGLSAGRGRGEGGAYRRLRSACTGHISNAFFKNSRAFKAAINTCSPGHKSERPNVPAAHHPSPTPTCPPNTNTRHVPPSWCTAQRGARAGRDGWSCMFGLLCQGGGRREAASGGSTNAGNDGREAERFEQVMGIAECGSDVPDHIPSNIYSPTQTPHHPSSRRYPPRPSDYPTHHVNNGFA